MLRHLGKEGNSLTIDWEVSGFLSAFRKPVAVEIESGGFQIVGIAHDPQHCASSARDRPGQDAPTIGLEDAIRFDT